MELGKTIREIRESKGITIKDLADRIEVSSSHISQVERDITSPSITMLKKMANVFEIPMTRFFTEDEALKETVIRKKERQKIQLPNSNFTYELLTPTDNENYQILLTTIEPGGKLGDKPIGHKGQETNYIEQGKVKFIVNDKDFILESGDTISYPEETPHNVENIGKTKAVIISVISPPGF